MAPEMRGDSLKGTNRVPRDYGGGRMDNGYMVKPGGRPGGELVDRHDRGDKGDRDQGERRRGMEREGEGGERLSMGRRSVMVVVVLSR